MRLRAQIYGYRLDRDRTLELKQKLERININVAHPIVDEFIFNKNSAAKPWTHYDLELDYYESVASSDFHIVYNNKNKPINVQVVLAMAFAMSKGKPIILLHPPIFSNISKPVEKIIKKRINSLAICDLHTLDDSDITSLCNNIANRPISYLLSNAELEEIKYQLRLHFRGLEKQVKQESLVRNAGKVTYNGLTQNNQFGGEAA